MAERITLRRRAGVLVATAGIIVGGLGLLPQASATSGAHKNRIFGSDRYGTAVDDSKHSYTTATDAVIASGETFPDALAASYVAGQVAGPVLLVTKGEIPSITSTELSGLGVKNVWLIGGTNAIAASVETQLSAKYTVKRLAGGDRYETAKAAATQTTGTVGTYKNDKTAIVASGENYPDALAGGALAYGKKLPLLLTAKDSLPSATSQALTSLGIKRVVLLGGSGAVSDRVAASIAATNGGITVERIGGLNRADTAARIGELALGALGFKNTEVVVGSGNGFADALAGATYAGKNLFPILLMGSVPPETAGFVKNHNSTIDVVTALGGTAVIPETDLDSLVTTAKCTPPSTTTTTAGLPITLLPPSTTTTTAPTSSTLPSCTTPTTAGATTTTAGGATTTAPTVLPTTTVATSGGTTTTNPLCGLLPVC
jgi:putative cell wall-binding protein